LIIKPLPLTFLTGFASNGPVAAAAANVPLAQQNYPSLPREEPEKIRKWREDQKLRLEQKGISFFILILT
jgi:hypothetical protein